MNTLSGASRWPRLPRAVWALGFTSLLMDASSELVHAMLPLYLAGVLGVSVLTIGLIEGVAEATGQITKVFSGWLSDRLRARKGLTLAGYGLAAISKPLFPLAASAAMVFFARFVDRIGKGIRGAPRDALVADVTPPGLRGAAFGLRQALDSVGAVLGPVAAIALLVSGVADLRAALWFAVIPAVLAVGVLAVGVEEPRRDRARLAVTAARSPARPPIHLADLAALPRRFWWIVALGCVFTLARFSEAFLVLRAAEVGIPTAWVPGVMALMSLVYAATAYPAGTASDRHGSRRLLAAGLVALIGADLLVAAVASPAGLLGGAALWGVHMGLTQGLLSRLVADAAPPDLRGSAFGLFSLATGVALFAASVVAGALWSTAGSSATFLAGAVFAALALGGLLGAGVKQGR